MRYIKQKFWWGYKDKNNKCNGLWIQKSNNMNGCSIDYKSFVIYQIFTHNTFIKLEL